MNTNEHIILGFRQEFGCLIGPPFDAAGGAGLAGAVVNRSVCQVGVRFGIHDIAFKVNVILTVFRCRNRQRIDDIAGSVCFAAAGAEREGITTDERLHIVTGFTVRINIIAFGILIEFRMHDCIAGEGLTLVRSVLGNALEARVDGSGRSAGQCLSGCAAARIMIDSAPVDQINRIVRRSIDVVLVVVTETGLEFFTGRHAVTGRIIQSDSLQVVFLILCGRQFERAVALVCVADDRSLEILRTCTERAVAVITGRVNELILAVGVVCVIGSQHALRGIGSCDMQLVVRVNLEMRVDALECGTPVSLCAVGIHNLDIVVNLVSGKVQGQRGIRIEERNTGLALSDIG